MEKRRRIVVALGALCFFAAVVHPPAADVRIAAHAAGDPAPHRFQAAVDLGLASGSILVTWTAQRVIR